MRWWEVLTVIASITAIIQFSKFVLGSLVGNKLESSLTLLLAIIFVFLFMIILLLIQINKETEKIKEFLKSKGFQYKEEQMANIINKNGFIKIDPKLLLVLLIAIFLYLIYKAFFS